MVALAILVLVSVVNYRTTTSMLEATASVERTHEVIERLGEERAALADARAARRAHGLTGDDAMLTAYADAIQRLDAKSAAVRALTVDNASQQQRLDELEPLLKKRIAMLDAAIDRKQRNASTSENDAEQTKAGAATDVPILSAMSVMENEELRLLALRRYETAQSVKYMRLVKAAGMIVSVAILLVAFRRLQREIVRRSQSEKVARDSEEMLATTLMSIGDGVISTDAEGRVVRLNRVAEALTGWTGGTAVGKPVPEVFRIVNEETGSTTATHKLLLRKDGSELPIADNCAPVRDTKGKVRGAVFVFRDVSHEQRARKLQEAAQRQILVSERMASIGTLAAGVAHEINNPLTYVTANLDMIIEEVRALSGDSSSGPTKELEDMAVDARDGAERVRKIVRGLKTFSRADEERRTVVNIRSVLEFSINMSFNEIRHRARLVKDYDEIPLVDADEARLGQVFINLLVNAAQAVPEGQTAANEIRILTFTDPAGRAVVEVRDTGPGIPRAVLGRVFDPFFTTKPVGIGTGLGLSICHNIITGMGGEITVTSEEGHGTTFRVVLPASSGQVPAHSIAASARAPAMPRAAVLVVDDESAVGNSLGRVLRDHEVTVVTRAKEALDLLVSGKHFDVILSDLMMPEMSGMSLYDELRKHCPEAAERVVFVTGGAFTPGADLFLDRVPNEVIEKPFDAKSVRALVHRLAKQSHWPGVDAE